MSTRGARFQTRLSPLVLLSGSYQPIMSQKKAALFAVPLLSLSALFMSLLVAQQQREDAAQPFGIAKRTPWTTSRIIGSPDPPPPYRVERAFPKLTFKNPLLLTSAPGSKRLFVGEHEGRLFSFPNNSDCAKVDLFLDLTTELHSWDKDGKIKGVGAVYGLTFHPRFAKNHYCYVCYILDSKTRAPLPDGTRVSRFRVSNTDPPRIDPKSEKVLITWVSGGHNGGCLQFGPDGFLYISTGDAATPNPPDALDTGQDVSDLLSSILRIDVDREEGEKPYAIPPDNPFIHTPKARPEIWAYGFRNPWKMSFDRQTGELWVGDVGWELWEMVYRVKKGGNYGWSVMEGRQPVRPNSRRGPTPILPPTLDFSHTEAASITGGFVYRGQHLKDLAGSYVCGDFVTGRLWGTRFDGDRIVSHRELARCPLHIVAFAEEPNGELLLLHYDQAGTIYRLVPNPAANDEPTKFPRKLSETGLFTSVKEHRPAEGVIPFDVQVEQWADHATAERFIALPGTSSVLLYDRVIPIPETFFFGRLIFPKGAVLARTISLEMERGQPCSRQRLETQILHFDGSQWHGYTYRWNDEQSDADLVPASGADQTFTIKDAQFRGGRRKQTWHFAGRGECLQCHNPWAGYALAFTPSQLDRDHNYGGVVDNQMRALLHAGVLTPVRSGGEPQSPARLVNPHDESACLDDRARSYLHVNCSHCHQFGAGGTADIDLRRELPVEQTKALDVRPVQGTFEIAAPRIIATGDPYRSVLYYRMAKLGRGRMPHIGSEIVDERGLRLIHDWVRQLPLRKDEDRIRQLPLRKGEQALADKLCSLDEAAIQAGPRRQSERQPAAERAEIIRRLLSSPSSALLLVRQIDQGRVPEFIRAEVVAAAQRLSEPTVRDLFERFVPDERRVRRLGNVIRPEQILSLRGDASRGKELFFKASVTQCVNCHRVCGVGSDLGPDLSQIAAKNTRTQLLESLLEPSKVIDPKYVVYTAETKSGQFHTGLLASRTAQAVVLRDAAGKERRIPASEVEKLMPQKTSLMPEQLLRDLTADQAADLLEFLASLK
jgi:putative heme-binding domain-containing protein